MEFASADFYFSSYATDELPPTLPFPLFQPMPIPMPVQFHFQSGFAGSIVEKIYDIANSYTKF